MTDDPTHDKEEQPQERPPDTYEAEADFKDRVKTLGNLAEISFEYSHELEDELRSQGEGQWRGDSPSGPVEAVWRFVIAIVVLLIIAVGAFYFTTGQDLLTGLNDVAAESSVGELESQNPVALTNGPWRFFADDAESRAVYDIQFEADGTCSVPGDPHVHGGSYVEDGSAVEITLFHRELLEAGSFSKLHENEEWFHMTRVGNTMYGTWEVEDSYYSEDGLVIEGTRINLPNMFARPEHPGDEG